MKKKIHNGQVWVGVFFALLWSCRQDSGRWKGKIEHHDGVMVVKNPIDPIYGKDIFSLEEDLSIGAKEGPDEYMFSRVLDIDVDDDGNIYALDLKESNIKVFDKEGRYLRTIGQRGQGPGELGSAYSISLTSQKHLIVEDVASRRLVFFTLEGEFIRNISSAKNFSVIFQADSQECLYGVTAVQDENPRYELRKFSPSLEVLHTVISSPAVLTKQNTYRAFSPQIMFDVGEDDNVFYAYPERYEINVCNPSGRSVRKICKEFTAVEITEEERKEIASRRLPPGFSLDIPRFHSAFQELWVDDQNRIFVRTWEKDDGGNNYDIFSAEGKYLARVLLDFTPSLIKENKIYAVETDEEGYQKIKRYQINWLV
ncbi:MAG: 6-bladed beta-propeller [Candidatus Aminicenantales bacterium]